MKSRQKADKDNLELKRVISDMQKLSDNKEKLHGKRVDEKPSLDEDFKTKFMQTDKKLQEFRVTNSTLKNELNKAMRVLSKEVGENFALDDVNGILFQLANDEIGWKGRAQQIEVLKGKIKFRFFIHSRELQNKLNLSSANMSRMDEGKSEYSNT